MKKLIYEIPVHDDNDAEMIAREIEAILGIRPARVEEVALLRDKREVDSERLGEGDPSALPGVRDDKGRDSSSLRSLGMTSGRNDMEIPRRPNGLARDDIHSE